MWWLWLFTCLQGFSDNIRPFILWLHFFLCFLVTWRLLVPLIPLSMLGSVHSGSASWDNCGQMFPTNCLWAPVGLVPTIGLDSSIVIPLRLCWYTVYTLYTVLPLIHGCDCCPGADRNSSTDFLSGWSVYCTQCTVCPKCILLTWDWPAVFMLLPRCWQKWWTFPLLPPPAQPVSIYSKHEVV